MWDFIVNFIAQNGALSILLGMALFLLTIAAIATAVSRSGYAYLGIMAILVGSWLFLRIDKELPVDEDFALGIAVALVYGGFVYLLCGWIGWTVRRRREGSEKKVAVRNLQYALPNYDNDYVRGRLQAISKTDDELCTSAQLQARESLPTELSYARELLAKVREKELSAADALMAEDLGKTFALYAKKEGFSYADVRAVNEGFCCLLKLAAKYAIES